MFQATLETHLEGMQKLDVTNYPNFYGLLQIMFSKSDFKQIEITMSPVRFMPVGSVGASQQQSNSSVQEL